MKSSVCNFGSDEHTLSVNAITFSPSAAADLVGSFRTFGEYGPTYQILNTVNGQEFHVVVVQTGEELDYPVSQALQDPESK